MQVTAMATVAPAMVVIVVILVAATTAEKVIVNTPGAEGVNDLIAPIGANVRRISSGEGATPVKLSAKSLFRSIVTTRTLFALIRFTWYCTAQVY